MIPKRSNHEYCFALKRYGDAMVMFWIIPVFFFLSNNLHSILLCQIYLNVVENFFALYHLESILVSGVAIMLNTSWFVLCIQQEFLYKLYH